MRRPSRRELLAVSASAAAVSLSGCLEAFAKYLGSDVEGKLVVSLTNLRRPTGTSGTPGTPADIVARVDIENRRPERATGRLEMELRYIRDGTTEQSWTKSEQIDVQSGISPQKRYVFEDAYQRGSAVPDDYELDAEIVDIEIVNS
ncbi:hypothetical protein [Halovenus sp. HT40]|uniref:hypothetical protein n=1 Tax=Halovenus sp. HT40 TaxID=3126691 RepID=UPI00300F5241